MTLSTRVETHGFELSPTQEGRIQRHLASLERRLVHRPDPSAVLILNNHPTRGAIEADLRVQLGPLGAHLVARETAETADLATRRALEHIERQLERRTATQRGEPSYGVPSRRRAPRPQPPEEESDG